VPDPKTAPPTLEEIRALYDGTFSILVSPRLVAQRAVAMMKEWAHHRNEDCEYGFCTCGLDAALAAWKRFAEGRDDE
jgi:hypothetical protein